MKAPAKGPAPRKSRPGSGGIVPPNSAYPVLVKVKRRSFQPPAIGDLATCKDQAGTHVLDQTLPLAMNQYFMDQRGLKSIVGYFWARWNRALKVWDFSPVVKASIPMKEW